jgi:hypothetical protein
MYELGWRDSTAVNFVSREISVESVFMEGSADSSID